MQKPSYIRNKQQLKYWKALFAKKIVKNWKIFKKKMKNS